MSKRQLEENDRSSSEAAASPISDRQALHIFAAGL
jgi:hypothetical protein